MFLAFSRIFSGVIRDGQTVQVLSAAYSPARPDQERLEVQVSTTESSSSHAFHSFGPAQLPCPCVYAPPHTAVKGILPRGCLGDERLHMPVNLENSVFS